MSNSLQEVPFLLDTTLIAERLQEADRAYKDTSPVVPLEDLPEVFVEAANAFYGGLLTEEQIAQRLQNFGITERILKELET